MNGAGKGTHETAPATEIDPELWAEVMAITEAMVPVPTDPTDDLPADFVEAKYLRAFADIDDAVKKGAFTSGFAHYQKYGASEDRLRWPAYRHAHPITETPNFPAHGADAVFWSPSGHAMVIGWIDDAGDSLSSISLVKHETVLGLTEALARCRRQDAERAVGAADGRLLGFWSVFACRTELKPEDIRLVLMTEADCKAIPAKIQQVSDERLREIALEYAAHASYWGHPQVEAFGFLDRGLGTALVTLSAGLARRIAAGAFCKRYGPSRKFVASIIVCLYGKVEYLFLQAALFSRAAGHQEFEFIYVSNSPELAERLCKEAELAARIYGISIALVILPGNAGFGLANNAAASFAQSDRILIVNPDVFPRSDDWAHAHTALLDAKPEAETRFFGVPLFYDDGSLMHAGMYFEMDEGFSVTSTEITRRNLGRVEHYGKGAPPNTAALLRSRPVPAVSGAFMSVDRDWFERLGGFSASYVFGHYEDADLCLRSLQAGTPVYLHNLPYWHLEGKGSTRRPVHEGGSLVNRWYFTTEWGGIIRDGMQGPTPDRLSRLEVVSEPT